MKTQNEMLVPEDLVINKIYFIRNQKVMLDRDLAELYNVETKHLKRQVNRNKDRFPEDFMFELTETEFENLRRQFGTTSWGGSRYLPMVFTEYGILMLSSVLNSKQAITVNIEIMRIFTKIRQATLDNTELRLAIEEIRRNSANNTQNIEIVFSYLDELMDKKENQQPRERIGYKIEKN